MHAPSWLPVIALSLVPSCANNHDTSWQMPRMARGPAPTPTAWVEAADSPDAPEPERGDLPEHEHQVASGFWFGDESSAWKEARRSNRSLLVDFSADWCFPCMLMLSQTFADEAVQSAIAAEFVPLRIDVTEESRSNREQLRRYGVRGLPAVLLIDSQGHEIDRIDQYLDVDAFLVRLGAAQAKLGRGEQARTP